MAAKKAKRRKNKAGSGKKVPARKLAMGRKRAAGSKKHAAKELVLGPLLGITDPRTDKRVDFVGGIRGTAELERRVKSGEMALAVSLFPTTVDQLLAVADIGAIMPPKSTWFEPKLRSGLFVHELD